MASHSRRRKGAARAALLAVALVGFAPALGACSYVQVAQDGAWSCVGACRGIVP